jgi:hypothetical protein
MYISLEPSIEGVAATIGNIPTTGNRIAPYDPVHAAAISNASVQREGSIAAAVRAAVSRCWSNGSIIHATEKN